MALKDPYCTVSRADEILASNDAWLALDEDVKESALVEARYYIDERYSCPYLDEDNIPTEMELVNAWLAADAVDTGLFSTSINPDRIKSKMVKAGSVTTSKTYFSATSFRPATKAKCDAYLSGICWKNSSAVVSLVRA
ncbi:MAG: hypothetical protein AB7C95_00905 [Synergistaceae bacterium]